MIVQNELLKLINNLCDHDLAAINIDGNSIVVRMVNDASKISLTSVLWHGNNFVPLSVREVVQNSQRLLNGFNGAKLILNEERSQVYLHYSEAIEELSHHQFTELLEVFSSQTTRWRRILDDNDKRDLIHIRIR